MHHNDNVFAFANLPIVCFCFMARWILVDISTDTAADADAIVRAYNTADLLMIRLLARLIYENNQEQGLVLANACCMLCDACLTMRHRDKLATHLRYVSDWRWKIEFE